MSEPRSLQDSLEILARQYGLAAPEILLQLERAWNDILGEQLSNHAHLRSLRDGVLAVGVDAGAWATQVRFLETELIARINDLIDPGLVREIRVAVERV